MATSKLFCPPRYRLLRPLFRDRPFRLLDVGCGALSLEAVRRFLPSAEYFGVDSRIQGERTQYGKMDGFFQVDLEKQPLTSIPDKHFDAVVFSHTIEHLRNGLEVLAALVKKVKVGGVLYVEFPSRRSLTLPSAEGTLNFFDDPTHVRFYDLKDIANVLLEHDVRILGSGTARHPVRAAVMTPVALAYNAYHLARYRRLSARGLIDVTGFASYVFGRRHDIPPEKRRGSWRETERALGIAKSPL